MIDSVHKEAVIVHTKCNNSLPTASVLRVQEMFTTFGFSLSWLQLSRRYLSRWKT